VCARNTGDRYAASLSVTSHQLLVTAGVWLTLCGQREDHVSLKVLRNFHISHSVIVRSNMPTFWARLETWFAGLDYVNPFNAELNPICHLLALL